MDEPRVPLEDYGNRQRPVDEPRGNEHTPKGGSWGGDEEVLRDHQIYPLHV